MALIGRIGAQGALGHVVEFNGPAISNLSAEGRMTLCNMMVEAGARGALIAPDAVTGAYLAGKPRPLRMSWPEKFLHSDPDARFDRMFQFDASGVSPQVTWGTSPDQVIGINETVPRVEACIDAIQRTGYHKALRYMALAFFCPLPCALMLKPSKALSSTP